MKRRDFIKAASPMLAIPFLLNGLPLRAMTRTPELDTMINALAETDRVLVLVQLNGGNDGINTVVPLDQLSTYNSLRTHVALPERSLLKINNNATGLHPALGTYTDATKYKFNINRLYQENKAVIVQGVSYPNPNLSHFRATDVWMSASDYDKYLGTGWAGRYLNTLYPGYPDGYPNTTMPDPPAIQIGGVMSLALQGSSQSMGIAINNPQSFYQSINGTKSGPFSEPPDTRPGNELKFLRQVEAESQAYASNINNAAKTANKATYPAAGTNSLADQLKIVASLVAGGLKTRIYVVSLGGFDTHAAQVDATDKTLGNHATLLARLSEAVGLFYEDLRLLGADNRVLTMTFSEFGRRVQDNASDGTDHGTAAPLFVFGNNVEAGIRGVNPSLTDLDNGNLKMQHDFRQVYASVLAQWFGANTAELNASVLKDFQQIPIVKQSSTGVTDDVVNATVLQLRNNPNPVNGVGTTIQYVLPESADVWLRVLDVNGRVITELVREYQSAGEHSIHFNADTVPSGTYFYEIRAGRRITSNRMIVEH
ncbi:MAG: DUF1501 domain-containing protein [Candidatus Kapabacteria bacterium]|nr:DUF1501 domain-containing protein [Candidatus Kapabacteria bacterium]